MERLTELKTIVIEPRLAPGWGIGARTVIVGAGIVGDEAAYHLAELGERDVLVLDQGPLFETGGSTSHAPGLAFQTNGSRMMCRIAQESVALYATLKVDGAPGWYGVGGIEVATTEARMRELKRRLGFARSYGLEGQSCSRRPRPPRRSRCSTLDDPGAYHVPRTASRRPSGSRARSGAGRPTAAAFEGGVAVTGFDVREGRVHGVRTDRGDRVRARPALRRDLGPTVGALAGVPVPLVAVQHQLVWTDPIPRARGRVTRGGAPDPPPPGPGDVLPPSRGPLRRRQLPPRADRHAAAAPSRRGTRMPSLMPFTPGDFEVAEAEAARAPRPEGAYAPDRSRTLDQRDVLVHAGRGLDRR